MTDRSDADRPKSEFETLKSTSPWEERIRQRQIAGLKDLKDRTKLETLCKLRDNFLETRKRDDKAVEDLFVTRTVERRSQDPEMQLSQQDLEKVVRAEFQEQHGADVMMDRLEYHKWLNDLIDADIKKAQLRDNRREDFDKNKTSFTKKSRP